MYESVRIQNFRGFEDLTVDGLTRVNLIVGANNVGKTALLEALDILANAPRVQAPYLFERWRKSPVLGTNTADAFEGLFRDFDYASRQIEITGETAVHRQTARLMVVPDTRTTVNLPSARAGVGTGEATSFDASANTVRIEFETDASDEVKTGTARLVADEVEGWRRGAVTFDAQVENTPSAMVPVHATTGTDDDPRRLTAAILAGKRDTVVRALQELEPRLRAVEILETGAGSGVFVDLGGGRLTPLGLMGSGTVRLLSMVVAGVAADGGVVLIDEIDTGIHYSGLQSVWRTMSEAADGFNYQLFATTHSYECMVAAYEAFADHPEDFSMHRLERDSDGSVVCKSFDHRVLGLALHSGSEVR